MTEKQLKNGYEMRSMFFNENHKFSVLLTKEIAENENFTPCILNSNQILQEIEKLSLYYELLKLENTFENYKKYMAQEGAIYFLKQVHTKINKKTKLKRIKLQIEGVK